MALSNPSFEPNTHRWRPGVVAPCREVLSQICAFLGNIQQGLKILVKIFVLGIGRAPHILADVVHLSLQHATGHGLAQVAEVNPNDTIAKGTSVIHPPVPFPCDWLGEEQDEDFDGECILDGEAMVVSVEQGNSAQPAVNQCRENTQKFSTTPCSTK